MNRGVYSLALRALAPLVWLWIARRARRAGGQWDIFSAERFGHPGLDSCKGAWSVPSAFTGAPVWVHAVSLGETRAAEPLLRKLLDRGLPVLLTHMTATGRAEGSRLFKDAIAQGQLRQAWVPYDFPGAAARFMALYGPRCGLLIEREIWPNLLAAARQAGVPMALISARFSESSLRQAVWMGGVMREALSGLNLVLAQTVEDAGRLMQAGAPKPIVTGNLKFDLIVPPALERAGHAWRVQLRRTVVAVASTREGEDAPFIAAILRHATQPGAPLFLLIPRHPQRFDQAAMQLREAGLSFVRRSSGAEATAETAVVLCDTLGEMAFYYASSDVAIVAGSFAALGGQNLIEACAAGVPVIVGPHTFNFQQAADDAINAGAVLRVGTPAEAVAEALALLADQERLKRTGYAARSWFETHAGAVGRSMKALAPWLA